MTGLRWMAGIISGLTGAMMLIVPHQFSNASYVLIAPHIEWWGVAFLLSGLGLLAAGVLQPGKPVLIAIHLFVGATWLFLALGFLLISGWIAVPVWAVFGLGIAIAPLLGGQDASLAVSGKTDLLSLLGGLTATLMGLLINVMLITNQLGNPVYSQIRAALQYAGLALLIAGFLLLLTTLPRFARLRPLYWGAHLLAGGLIVVIGVALSLQVRAWSGTAIYAGVGLSLALAPALRARPHRLAPSSLSARMSVFVSIALTISLVLAVTLAANYAFGRADSLSAEDIRSLRELTLGILLLSLAMAVAATAYTARWVGTPLHDLAGAASKLAGGDSTAVLPESNVQEVQDLVASFAEMRSRLVAREAERDRSEQERERLLQQVRRQATELVSANAELRQSEERYRTLAEGSQDFIFTLDREGRITYLNRYSVEQFGLQPEDVVGKPLASFYPADEARTVASNNRQVIESGQAKFFEDRAYSRGREMWLSTRLVPLKDEAGEVYAILGVSRDTTERKRAEEALREHHQQLAVVEERQRIARELHDSVTQGLYGVTLYSEAASLLLQAGDLPTLSEHLREIQAISQEALREMRLLIFELRPPVLEKEGLVAAIEARLDSVEGRGGIETALRVEGEPRLTRVLEEELYRITQEALNNALKHSKAHLVKVSLEFGDDRVCLEIADDGVGFEPGALSGKGGLGLKGMAERTAQIGGRLAVTSALGRGTRVRVEVALAGEPALGAVPLRRPVENPN